MTVATRAATEASSLPFFTAPPSIDINPPNMPTHAPEKQGHTINKKNRDKTETYY